MNAILRWIDDRTELLSAVVGGLGRRLPGGPGIRYVLPSALAFTFVVEAITGVVLWMYYSPGAQSAWESVYWLQERVLGGWLLRGIHVFAGHLMVVLALLWLLQLVATWMYRAPREFVFWVALGIFGTLLGLLLTGDLLRGDDEGATATQVRVRFLQLLDPGGAEAYKVAAGGPEFGSLTLTRFFALHAGVLGVVLLVLLVCNHRLLAQHGLGPRKDAGRFWPGQAAMNGVAWLLLMVIVGLLVFLPAMTGGGHAGQSPGEYLGAPLGAPADPGTAYPAARPEWAFLALYQFAHMFEGTRAVIPIFIVPGILACYALLMPFIGRWLVGHLLNLLVTIGLLGAAVWLSVECVRRDRADADHQAALAAGHHEAQRVKELVRSPAGIPVSGARTLLREDPKSQGPKLFAQHCVSCHNYRGGTPEDIKAETRNPDGTVTDSSSAPNLFAFASRAWIRGLLDPKRIAGPDYFGKTANFRSGDMVSFVKETFADQTDEEKKELESAVMALSAEAALVGQRQADAQDAQRIRAGRKLLVDDYGCTDCHKFHDKGKLGGAPDLTGYGSREWLIGIIGNPAHKRFYGQRNERMPVYAEFPEEPAKNILSSKAIELLADWLRGEWYEPANR